MIKYYRQRQLTVGLVVPEDEPIIEARLVQETQTREKQPEMGRAP